MCGKYSEGGDLKCGMNLCCSHYGWCGVSPGFFHLLILSSTAPKTPTPSHPLPTNNFDRRMNSIVETPIQMAWPHAKLALDFVRSYLHHLAILTLAPQMVDQ